MLSSRSIPRLLQQQPTRRHDMQQQQSGSSDFQPKPQQQQQPRREQQMGEGSYEATRDYQKNIGDYLKKADVEKDAEAAKPRSQGEAEELQRAEEEGRSHARK